jgi:hypothetical protein
MLDNGGRQSVTKPVARDNHGDKLLTGGVRKPHVADGRWRWHQPVGHHRPSRLDGRRRWHQPVLGLLNPGVRLGTLACTSTSCTAPSWQPSTRMCAVARSWSRRCGTASARPRKRKTKNEPAMAARSGWVSDSPARLTEGHQSRQNGDREWRKSLSTLGSLRSRSDSG